VLGRLQEGFHDQAPARLNGLRLLSLSGSFACGMSYPVPLDLTALAAKAKRIVIGQVMSGCRKDYPAKWRLRNDRIPASPSAFGDRR